MFHPIRAIAALEPGARITTVSRMRSKESQPSGRASIPLRTRFFDRRRWVFQKLVSNTFTGYPSALVRAAMSLQNSHWRNSSPQEH